MAESRIRVFLAEDHEMVAAGLKAVLAQQADIRVLGHVGDGLQVLDRVMDLDPDVVILDVCLPGLNGLDACRELHRKSPRLPILILSGHGSQQLMVRAIGYGAAGYLRKEMAGEHLTNAVRALARGETYLGPGTPRSILDQVAGLREDPYEQLSTREREVLQLIAEGHSRAAIGQRLGISPKTVVTHRDRLMGKLDLHSLTELVKFAAARGLIFLD